MSGRNEKLVIIRLNCCNFGRTIEITTCSVLNYCGNEQSICSFDIYLGDPGDLQEHVSIILTLASVKLCWLISYQGLFNSNITAT